MDCSVGCLRSWVAGISVYSNEEKFGFSFMMNDETKERAKKSYSEYLQYLLKQATEEQCGLLVLDEIISAYNLNFVDHDTLLQFLKHKPENMEVVLSGRDPADELVQLADYIVQNIYRKYKILFLKCFARCDIILAKHFLFSEYLQNSFRIRDSCLCIHVTNEKEEGSRGNLIQGYALTDLYLYTNRG